MPEQHQFFSIFSTPACFSNESAQYLPEIEHSVEEHLIRARDLSQLAATVGNAAAAYRLNSVALSEQTIARQLAAAGAPHPPMRPCTATAKTDGTILAAVRSFLRA